MPGAATVAGSFLTNIAGAAFGVVVTVHLRRLALADVGYGLSGHIGIAFIGISRTPTSTDRGIYTYAGGGFRLAGSLAIALAGGFVAEFIIQTFGA